MIGDWHHGTPTSQYRWVTMGVWETNADSDEAGHLFQSEAGQRSDLKPDAVPRRSRTLTASPYGSRPVFSGPRDPVKCRGDFEVCANGGVDRPSPVIL